MASGYQFYYGTFEITGSALNVNVILKITTGLNDLSLTSVRVFPNPFTDQITLNNTSMVKQILVTNVIGQRLFLNDYNNESVIKIETIEFISGVYIIKLISKDGTSHVIRLVKN